MLWWRFCRYEPLKLTPITELCHAQLYIEGPEKLMMFSVTSDVECDAGQQLQTSPDQPGGQAAATLYFTFLGEDAGTGVRATV